MLRRSQEGQPDGRTSSPFAVPDELLQPTVPAPSSDTEGKFQCLRVCGLHVTWLRFGLLKRCRSETIVARNQDNLGVLSSHPTGQASRHAAFTSPLRRPTMSTPGGCASCSRTTGASGAPMKRCSKCHDTLYCSRECQLKDWPSYKTTCRPTDISPPPNTIKFNQVRADPVQPIAKSPMAENVHVAPTPAAWEGIAQAITTTDNTGHTSTPWRRTDRPIRLPYAMGSTGFADASSDRQAPRSSARVASKTATTGYA